MATDLLLRVLLASAFSSALVLLLRRPLRAWGGSIAAYAAWACVPACMLAALLPHSASPMQLVLDVPLARTILPSGGGGAVVTALPWQAWLGALWLCGAGFMLAVLAWQQLRYQRLLRKGAAGGLGNGIGGRVLRSGAAGSGPVLLGVWAPRLVLPSDFRQGYGKQERRLVLAHERIHAKRGDLWANAACALLQCLAWCNPLIHIAASRFRLDQELACDETVLRRHGQAATYARALLKTQLSAQGIPLACQWQAAHPLKERIVNLKSTITPAQRLAGRFAAGLLLTACSLATWAAQTSATTDKQYLVTLSMMGSNPTVLVSAGMPAEIAMGKGAEEWRIRLVATPNEDQVQMRALVTHGDKQVGDYTITGPLGQDIFIGSAEVEEFKAKLRVREKTGD